MQYIDTHSHYGHRLFNGDRDALIKSLLSTNLQYIIECGTDVISNKKVIGLTEQYENVYGVIGFFPTNSAQLASKTIYENFVSQLNLDKIIGLGEIGLDYYHRGNPAEQKKWFIEQLKLARRLNLPVCIHSRDAEQDTLSILKNHGKNLGVIHCYAYGVKTMKELMNLGYYFGVGGTCTYKNNTELRNAIKEMPLDRIVLETDCPFLTPDAVRRERNDSSKLLYVIKEIAKLKGIPEEDVIQATNENVKRLYPKMFKK